MSTVLKVAAHFPDNRRPSTEILIMTYILFCPVRPDHVICRESRAASHVIILTAG